MTGSTRSSDGLDDRRKRLLFRCWHRGTREMDLILGRFADAEIASLTEQELAQLERLIEVPGPRPLCRLDRRNGRCRPNMPTPFSSASRPQESWITAHEGAGPIARTAPRCRPPADLCQCGRGCRGARGLGPRARGRGAAEAVGGQPRRGLPRWPAHAATGTGAGILRARSAGDAVPGLGLSAIRSGVAAWRHPGATADHAGTAGATGRQRQAPDRADHGQRHCAAGAGTRDHRRAGAVGGARPCRADGFHRVVAGA